MIRVQAAMSSVVGALSMPALGVLPAEFNQDAGGYFSNVLQVGTTAEELDLGGITVPGWAFFRNLDATNFIEVGRDDTGFISFARLRAGSATVAGEWFLGPVGPGAIWAKADTAAARLQYIITER
jgi:hypothetical protein